VRKKRRGVFFLVCAVVMFIPSGTVFAEEHMAIKANEGQNRVLVMPNMPLDVTINLSPGSYNGLSADWWLFAETDMGVFHYNLDGNWSPGRQVSYQGPLFEFPDLKVLSMTGLPPGDYKITFALDPIVDGVLNNEAVIDQVDVRISPFNCPANSAESLAALSQVQQNFIATRGNPDIFVLGFSSERIDESGQVVYFDKIRRVETWFYNNGSQLSSAVFDNGFFVKESRKESVPSLVPTHLSPSQFTHCMSKSDVIALMGEPNFLMRENMGGRMYQYLRYDPAQNRPAATVVLENGLLVSVTAGFSIDYPELANVYNNQ